MRGKKSGKHNVFFQPLFINDMQVYFNENRGVQVLKEFTPEYIPNDINDNVKKSCVALFIGEVLMSVVKEEESNIDLYTYIERAIVYFNMQTGSFANFHVAFLAGLCRFLGFEPGKQNSSDTPYFDLNDGKFVVLPPLHGNYANDSVSSSLALFLSRSFDEANDIKISGQMRNDLLDTLLTYINVHIPLQNKIKSLEVMREVFR